MTPRIVPLGVISAAESLLLGGGAHATEVITVIRLSNGAINYIAWPTNQKILERLLTDFRSELREDLANEE